MTTQERQAVRRRLIIAGFHRITSVMPENPKYYDHSGRGNYTEMWQHKQDNTLITVEWDIKTKE